MRLIDADELLKQGKYMSWSVQKWVSEVDIGLMSTVDAVEVVRCKECRHYVNVGKGHSGFCYFYEIFIATTPDDFCSRGERK